MLDPLHLLDTHCIRWIALKMLESTTPFVKKIVGKLQLQNGHFPDLAFSVDFLWAFALIETSRPVILGLGCYSDGSPGFEGYAHGF